MKNGHFYPAYSIAIRGTSCNVYAVKFIINITNAITDADDKLIASGFS